MNENQKEFLRKLEIRKSAVINSGIVNTSADISLTGYGENTELSFSERFALLNENLLEAEGNSFEDGYRVFRGKKLSIFIKKVMRKIIKIFMGWYIFPIFSKQSHYNGKIINAVSLLRDEASRQQNALYTLTEKISKAEECLTSLKEEIRVLEKQSEYALGRLGINCNLDLLNNSREIDYFDFENRFRGSRELIIQRQKAYVDYFKMNGSAEILDIGCGRGEFLELMYNHGINARGIDVYNPFVDFCNERGFKAERADALTHLNGLENSSLGGVFMSQVVEHLPHDYLVALLKEIYKKMKSGTYLIIETPNPESVSTYINFYIDFSHNNPVHFLTMEYFLKSIGFTEINRINTEDSKYPFVFPSLANEDKDVNDSIRRFNEVMFNSRDYAAIARK